MQILHIQSLSCLWCCEPGEPAISWGGDGVWAGVPAGSQQWFVTDHSQVLCLEEEEFPSTGIVGQLSPFLLLFYIKLPFPSLHGEVSARGHVVLSVEKPPGELTAHIFRQLPPSLMKNET